MFKKILLVLLVVLIIMQFLRPEKNIAQGPSTNDISTHFKIPVDVQTILNKSCNDCHSNNTKYPWYSQLQPVAWWLNDHINEGKQHLNFSEFATYSLRKQYHKLEEVAEQVEKGEMPLSSYTIMHTNAKLSKGEKDKLISWSSALRDTMKAQYPIDSLVRKKQ